MNNTTQINTKLDISIQSGRPSSEIQLSPEAQRDVHQAYLVTMRQRFKTEINRLTRGDMSDLLAAHKADYDNLSFLMTYIYAWSWLQQNIHNLYQEEVLAAFANGPQAFLMDLILKSNTSSEFIDSYISYWQNYQGEPQLQQQQMLILLQQSPDKESLISSIEATWNKLHLFNKSFAIGYKDLAKKEKDRYADMLADEDRERLKLVDELPDTPSLKLFNKLGIIPAMGCPQTCRHCMFIFRPLMKNTQDPDQVFQIINKLTTSVLFTGGDLTKHLDHFYNAISSMQHVTTFAILLNGDFADSREVTETIMQNMATAIRRRHITWPKAKVNLQISFDEFHQEVVVDRKGNLKERIPVVKIANIVEAAPRFADEIQLCLCHKQSHLNFSMDVFKKGVFARLTKELGRRGHQIQILAAGPSTRLKRNPHNPETPAQVIKDATFVLSKYPSVPLMLTSSTIDAYGRAEMMELHESVNERDLLKQMLDGKGTGAETFDNDLMFWFNGWATLFSAVHISLGNIFEDGIDVIRQRQAKDPLSNAMFRFDIRLLDYYREKRDDLDSIIEKSTGPHHLFHTITEEGAMRLHMTKRLLESANTHQAI
ncbi:MAG: radical SAM protein [Gammaproteobacteria bacterium]|nr:radical SAM protein [Gammaproteobacteria bacterium]